MTKRILSCWILPCLLSLSACKNSPSEVDTAKIQESIEKIKAKVQENMPKESSEEKENESKDSNTSN
jgi:hypothetical protein